MSGFGVNVATHPQGAPRGRRRWGRIIVGFLLILFVALPMLAVGILLVIGNQAAATLDPEAVGRVPGEVSFDAGRERYVIALGSGLGSGGTRSERRVFAGESSEVDCTVTHPDGTTSEVRGNRQVASVSTSDYETVGEFTGKGGSTTVECRFRDETDLLGTTNDAPLIVHDKREELLYGGIGFVIGSIVVILASAGLIAWGGRRRP